MGVIKRKFREKAQYFEKMIIYLLKLGVQIFRIITVVRSSSIDLNWAATGFSIQVFLMLDWWPFNLIWRVFSVSPTYCFLHLEHLTEQSMFLDLQVTGVSTRYIMPVTVLLSVAFFLRCLLVLQWRWQHW